MDGNGGKGKKPPEGIVDREEPIAEFPHYFSCAKDTLGETALKTRNLFGR
ncbi:hypothetical protein ABB02_00688 [Clostridiaceae bacterium JG1575]|nr:hypothetical protein ABB02_00688 [Clostridiaceae bacterium JG1575]